MLLVGIVMFVMLSALMLLVLGLLCLRVFNALLTMRVGRCFSVLEAGCSRFPASLAFAMLR